MDAIGFRVETPAVVEPWRKVLLDAADYIEAHGWKRCDRGDPHGPVCAHGAMQMAVSGDTGRQSKDHPLHMEAATHLYHYLRAKFPDDYIGHISLGYAGIAPWNNELAQSSAEVTAALRACARS